MASETDVKNLFKSSDERNRCRLFIGNLPTDKMTVDEVKDIFKVYGNILEVTMRKAFGFVQYDNESSVHAAIEGEKGRVIAGKTIDPQVAGGGGSSSGRGNRDYERRERGGGGGSYGYDRRTDSRRERDDGSRRERSRSPGRDRGRGREYSSRVPPPLDGKVVKVLLLGGGQRRFADFVADEIERTGIPFKVEMLDGRNLGQALKDTEENMTRYAIVIGRENAKNETVCLKLLSEKRESQGTKCPTLDVGVQEMVDIIVDSERKLGFRNAGPPPPPEADYRGPPPFPEDPYRPNIPYDSSQMGWKMQNSPYPHQPPPSYPPNPPIPPVYTAPSQPLPHAGSSTHHDYPYQPPPPTHYHPGPYPPHSSYPPADPVPRHEPVPPSHLTTAFAQPPAPYVSSPTTPSSTYDPSGNSTSTNGRVKLSQHELSKLKNLLSGIKK